MGGETRATRKNTIWNLIDKAQSACPPRVHPLSRQIRSVDTPGSPCFLVPLQPSGRPVSAEHSSAHPRTPPPPPPPPRSPRVIVRCGGVVVAKAACCRGCHCCVHLSVLLVCAGTRRMSPLCFPRCRCRVEVKGRDAATRCRCVCAAPPPPANTDPGVSLCVPPVLLRLQVPAQVPALVLVPAAKS